MPYLSVIVPTMRVGGLDILFDALARQDYTDFELVLVDGLFKQREKTVRQKAWERFLRVAHVEPRDNPFPDAAFCRYANTGLLAAKGEVALFMVDYSRPAPDCLGKHAAFHRVVENRRRGLMGPHRYVRLATEGLYDYGQGGVDAYARDALSGLLDGHMWSLGRATDEPDRPHAVDGGREASHDADPKLRRSAGPLDPGHFHGKNESVRLEYARAAGGWDEDLDGTHLYQDSDFAYRMTARCGVQWELDPACLVDIANPRHVFPFARRSRGPETNLQIFNAKRAAGYPPDAAPLPNNPCVSPTEPRHELEVRMSYKIAMIYGEFSSAIHGPFDLTGLYTRVGLTGSESSFFNLARTLAERGHEVVAFCDCEAPLIHPSGLTVMPIRALQAAGDVELDAAIAWNEPDYLRFIPPRVHRFVDQQLNDFGYCRHPEWRALVDTWVSPSKHHLDQILVADAGLPVERCHVIPNSVDLDLVPDGTPERDPLQVVYASSPDRGLHHLLAVWPRVRAKVPGAKLKVFYRLEPWLDRARGAEDAVGRRARYIEAALPRLAGMGVEVAGPVPNVQMMYELSRATVLAYPCDPVRYTEGFGCSVLDATAAGCVPVISDADALPSVHGAAVVLTGKPAGRYEDWADAIGSVLILEGGAPQDWRDKMQAHAEAHSRERVTIQWEKLMGEVMR